MNIFMKLGYQTDIVHVIFEEILVPELQNETTYAGKLKKTMEINMINTNEHAYVKAGDWTHHHPMLLQQLCDMNFKLIVLWFDGSWPSSDQLNDELLKCLDEWGSEWLVAGHLIDRLVSAESPTFHKQCIVLNAKKYQELNFPMLEYNLPGFPKYIASEENIHDDYTPMYLEPIGDDWPNLDFTGDSFDALIPISLMNNLYVHNLPYSVRNEKYCMYPEDDIEETKEWFLDPEWNKRTDIDTFEYPYDNVHEDKRELYGFKVMDSQVIYITNTETVPMEDKLDANIIAVPCSGLSQFKHMANAIDTLERVVWFDFSPYAIKWISEVLDKWDGRNFTKFWYDNKHLLKEWGFFDIDVAIFEEDSVEEFYESFGGEDEWVKIWERIKKVEHKVIQLDVVKEYEKLINKIDSSSDKTVFLQTSNIWSYEINYLNTPGFAAQTAYLNLLNELVLTSKDLIYTGDTPHGFYHNYINIKQLSGVL